jgi:hypothetical protein
MAEEIVYSDNNVQITTTRVAVLGTTYPLRNITSVRMTETPPSKGCAMLVGIVGAMLSLFLSIPILLMMFDVGTFDLSALFVALLGFGMALGGFGVALTAGSTFHVIMGTSSGEVQALQSQDRDYIARITSSINDAIAQS